MEDTKLTLKLNASSIARAKEYSAKNKVSLSAMVEKYFDGLTVSEPASVYSAANYSPIVNELSGLISIPENYDYKADLLEHLEEKYE